MGHAVIQSYRNKHTEAFADGETIRQFQPFSRQGYRRLEILDAATSLTDLQQLPSNRLEALKGNRFGQFSIRINAQWRICFEWPKDAKGPQNVEIVDYHR
jgi:toxin HigB-1